MIKSAKPLLVGGKLNTTSLTPILEKEQRLIAANKKVIVADYNILPNTGGANPVVGIKGKGNKGNKGNELKNTSSPDAKQLNVSKDKYSTPENPGITQSRVNVANVTYDNGKTRGFEYAMGKHGVDASVPNKSRFIVANYEVKELLQRLDIVNKPVYNPIQIGGKIETDKFVRQVDVGKSIGIDQSGKNTSVITIITDKKGNLINTFPGAL